MNNNQFKRFIREQIETLCNKYDLITIYVDTSTTTRMYYIYDKNTYSPKGTIENWLGNEQFSLRVSTNKEKRVSLANRDAESQGNFLEMQKMLIAIENYIKMLKEN